MQPLGYSSIQKEQLTQLFQSLIFCVSLLQLHPLQCLLILVVNMASSN